MMATNLGRTGKGEPVENTPDSDVDAEGDDEEDELQQPTLQPTVNGLHTGQPVEDRDSDEDAEGDDDDSDIAMAGAGSSQSMKRAKNREASITEDDIDQDRASVSVDSHKGSKRNKDTETESGSASGEDDWQAHENDGVASVEGEDTDLGVCMFCGQDEDHDPGEDYEEYLSCVVCGNHAHPHCARTAGSISPDNVFPNWRCQACLAQDLQPAEGTGGGKMTNGRRRSSVPKIARDLLPSQRGATKPDSHSVFNTLILDDDPMDGSRSLRKRKSSDELERRPDRKRRRTSEAETRLRVRETTRSLSPKSLRAVQLDSEADILVLDPGHEAADETSRRRRRRPISSHKPLVTSVPGSGVLVLSFNLDRDRLQAILSRKPRKNRGRNERKKKILAIPQILSEPEPSHYPAIQNVYTGQNLFMNEREEENKKPYGGILSEAEADTTKTFPNDEDRKRFERARLKAEEAWKEKLAALAAASDLKRLTPKALGQPVKIQCINFGGYEIDTWHTAPYPEEYSRNRVLYVCEFCLKYMNSDYVAWRHKLKCPAKHPPGDEIYRKGKHSFFEVDGRKNPLYCQNLCLLAKLFLGSKTLYYDVEPFLFYVMTENDEYGHRFVGYFSKEKRPSSLNNVSCILTLPIHQRKGFGHMLIDFSYLLTKVEQKTGSPEKPLSDMGLVTYRGYWRLVLCQELLRAKEAISISTLSDNTGMTADDIVSALEGMRALVRDPVTKTYALRLDHEYMREYVAKYEEKAHPKIDPESLIWEPYVMGRKEEAPAMATVAQRDDEDEDLDMMLEEGVQLEQVQKQVLHASVNGDLHDERPDVAQGIELDLQPSPSRTEPPTPQADSRFGSVSFASQATSEAAAAPVPAARFEVFPPLKRQPSSIRRRSGRPFGHRRKTVTPLRRSTTLTNGIDHSNLETPSASGTFPSRNRSKLGEEIVNGVESDNEVADVERAAGMPQLDGLGDAESEGDEANGSIARSKGAAFADAPDASGDDDEEDDEPAENDEDAEGDAEYEDAEDAEEEDDDDDAEGDPDVEEEDVEEDDEDDEDDADAEADEDMDDV